MKNISREIETSKRKNTKKGIKPKSNKFTNEESIRLIKLHKENNSKWKTINSFFENKTRNQIKNQFFSLVRKAFRKICKYYKISESKFKKM